MRCENFGTLCWRYCWGIVAAGSRSQKRRKWRVGASEPASHRWPEAGFSRALGENPCLLLQVFQPGLSCCASDLSPQKVELASQEGIVRMSVQLSSKPLSLLG